MSDTLLSLAVFGALVAFIVAQAVRGYRRTWFHECRITVMGHLRWVGEESLGRLEDLLGDAQRAWARTLLDRLEENGDIVGWTEDGVTEIDYSLGRRRVRNRRYYRLAPGR